MFDAKKCFFLSMHALWHLPFLLSRLLFLFPLPMLFLQLLHLSMKLPRRPIGLSNRHRLFNSPPHAVLSFLGPQFPHRVHFLPLHLLLFLLLLFFLLLSSFLPTQLLRLVVLILFLLRPRLHLIFPLVFLFPLLQQPTHPPIRQNQRSN